MRDAAKEKVYKASIRVWHIWYLFEQYVVLLHKQVVAFMEVIRMNIDPRRVPSARCKISSAHRELQACDKRALRSKVPACSRGGSSASVVCVACSIDQY